MISWWYDVIRRVACIYAVVIECICSGWALCIALFILRMIIISCIATVAKTLCRAWFTPSWTLFTNSCKLIWITALLAIQLANIILKIFSWKATSALFCRGAETSQANSIANKAISVIIPVIIITWTCKRISICAGHCRNISCETRRACFDAFRHGWEIILRYVCTCSNANSNRAYNSLNEGNRAFRIACLWTQILPFPAFKALCSSDITPDTLSVTVKANISRGVFPCRAGNFTLAIFKKFI